MPLTSPSTDDTGAIVRLLVETPAAKAALAQQAAEQTLARRGIIAQIKALERAHEKRVPQLETELAAALAAYKTAEKALLAAQKRAGDALGARSTASYSYSAQRDRLEAQLRASANGAVDPWIREMRAEMDLTRKRFAFIEEHETTNPVTRMQRRVVVNNADSVKARVAALFAAIDEAERLKLELADQSDIPKLLGELAAALPVVQDPKR